MLGNLIFDHSGNIKFVSKDTEQHLGYAPGSLNGARVQDLFIEKHLSGFLKEGTVWVRLEKHDNPLGPLEVSIQVLEPKDGSDEPLFCARINLFKNSELIVEEEKPSLGFGDGALAEIEFLSRELSRCICSLDSNKEERASLERMSVQLSDLISEFSDVSEKMPVKEAPVPVNVKELLEELFAFYRSYLEFSGIDFAFELLEIEGEILLPRSRLFCSLVYLMAKAFRSGDLWKVSVKARKVCVGRLDSISFTVDCEARGNAVFSGSSIKEKTFKFVRRGSLAIRFVKSISGSCQFKQERVDAFQFTLSVPISDSGAKIGEKVGSQRGSKRILVVEDNQLNIDIISHFLRDYGYPFDVVENGKEAVEAYEDGKYDLILMDIMLPVMNGYEATKNIILKAKDGAVPPVIGVTAKVFRDDDELCLDCGMQEIVHKPINFQNLKKVLDRTLLKGPFEVEPESKPIKSATAYVSRTRDIRADDIFDWNVAEDYLERMESSENSREVLVVRYLKEISSCLDRIEASIPLNEAAQEIQRHAHSLKGNLGLVGANNMQDLARGLEMTASRNSEHFNPKHWLDLLRVSYDDLERSMRSLI